MPLSNSADVQAQVHALNHLLPRENWTVMKFNYALILMSLENVRLQSASTPPKSSYVAPSVSPLLLDHPFNLEVLSKETSVVPISEANKSIYHPSTSYTLQLRDTLRNLKNYSVLEVFETSGLLQELISLQFTHPYIEVFKHAHSEVMILAVHAGFDGSPQHKHTLSSHTHTKVGFQNYLQYVNERYSHLIAEAIEEDAQSQKKFEKEKKEIFAQKLKEAEDRQQEVLTPVEEELSADTTTKGKKKSESATHRGSVPKIAKKSTVSTDTPMSSNHDFHTSEVLLPEFEKEKRFMGYDMGDEVMLKESTHTTLFTADGVQVQSTKHRVLNNMPSPIEVSLLHNGHRLVCCQVLAHDKAHAGETRSRRKSGIDSGSRSATPQPEGNRIPQPPCGLKSAFFHAHFNNSLRISCSHYGLKANGKLPYLPYHPKILDHSPQSDFLQAIHTSQQGVSPKLNKKQQEHQQQLLEQQRVMEAQMEKERKLAKAKYQREYDTLVRNNKCQQLHISTEFGLEVKCQVFIDSIEDTTTLPPEALVVIKQKYSFPGSASHLNEHVSKEKCRFYHSEGYVVKFLVDDSIVILCADGTQYHSACSKEVEMFNKKKKTIEERSTTPQLKSSSKDLRDTEVERSNRMISSASKSIIEESVEGCLPTNNKIWVVTTNTGDRYMFEQVQRSKDSAAEELIVLDPANSSSQIFNDVKRPPVIVPLSPVHLLKATDPVTKEVSLSVFQCSWCTICLSNCFIF